MLGLATGFAVGRRGEALPQSVAVDGLAQASVTCTLVGVDDDGGTRFGPRWSRCTVRGRDEAERSLEAEVDAAAGARYVCEVREGRLRCSVH